MKDSPRFIGGMTDRLRVHLRTSWVSMRQIIFGVLDQGASSLSNALAAFMIARVSTRTSFGEFSLVLISYAVMLGTSRALYSEPYAFLVSHAGDKAASYALARKLVSRVVVLGLIAQIVTLALVVSVTGGHLGLASGAILAAFPLLAVQDYLRFVCIAWREPFTALAADSLWLITFTAISVSSTILGNLQPPIIATTWSLTGISSILVMKRSLSSEVPIGERHLGVDRVHLRKTIKLGTPAASEYLILTSASQGVFFLAAVSLGSAGIAGPRGALLLQGPITVILLGASQSLMPLIAHRAGGIRRSVWAMQVAFAAIAACVYALLFSLSDGIGESLLGETWAATREVLIPWGVYAILIGITIPLVMQIRISRAAKDLFRARLFVAPVTLALGFWGAQTSPLAFSWGLATAQILDTLIVYVVAKRVGFERSTHVHQ